MSIITTHPPKFSSTEGIAPLYVLQLSGVESGLGKESNQVEIGSQPVMIGSGPRCTLRLDTPGTKPVHCVVSLGEEGPVVRRWAAETLLNGETFTEALLAEGDRLSIGTVEVVIHRLDEAVQPLSQESSPQESTLVEQPEEFDPAVPQHLLTPWSANKPEEEAPVSEVPENAEVEVAPEHKTDPVEKTNPVEESVSESLSEIADWIGGESEWTTTDEATEIDTEEDSEEAVVEESNIETDSEELLADPWAIELTPVSETSPSTQVETDESSESLLSEEVNAWVTDSVSEEMVQDSEEEPVGRDPFAETPAESFAEAGTNEPIATADLSDFIEAPVDAESLSAIEALRTRLAVRADRLRQVVATLRSERAEREQQVVVAIETVALVEQLQMDLESAKRQAGDDAASLTALQNELTAANELIETLEASLHEAIEASSGVVYEEPQEPVAETSTSVEEEPELEGESSPWPRTAEVIEPENIEPENFIESPVEAPVDAPIAAEDLWGIEHLAAESPIEEPIVHEEPSAEIPEETEEAWVETPVEETSETSEEELTEELTGSLDDVLLPGETPVELPTEPEAVSVAEAIDDGSSVLASLMTRPSHETEEPTETPVEAESFIDRFAHLLPEESEEEALQEPALPVSPAFPENAEPEPSPSDTSSNEEGDESLDDYMKKMMDRIRGDEAPVAVAPKVSQPVKIKAKSEAASVAQEAVAPEPEQAPLQNLDEIKRGPTRQLGADLGELRQLANQSARRAIDVSETNDQKEHATMRLVIAGIGATCGLLACLTAPSLIDWQFYAGLAGVAGGGYLGFRTLKVIQHAAALKATAAIEVNGTGI